MSGIPQSQRVDLANSRLRQPSNNRTRRAIETAIQQDSELSPPPN